MELMAIDAAIDLGTSRTRIFLPEKGLVVDEPSVVTVDLKSGELAAVGQQAYLMIGRTSDRLQAVYPLSGGVISESSLVEGLIDTLLRRVISPKLSMPRAVVCMPGEITEVEKRAVISAITGAGVRRICLIEEAVAAAMGALTDISSPHGLCVIDIGGGTTDMAVITLGGVAVSRSIRQAGDAMDEELIRYVRQQYHLLIGKRTAEEIKMRIGCMIPGSRQGKMRVKGRNLLSGLPSWTDLCAEETAEPLLNIARQICGSLKEMLEETPPELIGDISADGIILTGGAARIAGFDKMIEAGAKLTVRTAPDADTCVIRGCGEALKYITHNPHDTKGIINPIAEYF